MSSAGQQSKDLLFANYEAGKQTFIIPLTFPDLRDGRDVLSRIAYGGDIWEVRVDLLCPPGAPIGETNVPSVLYVREQIEFLQALSPLPILFTIRTKSQGGKFPDHAAQEALELMLLAVEKAVAYIDVEIEWPQETIHEIVNHKGLTKLVASYHSWTGDVAWSSQELRQRYEAADAFGDIVKVSILSATIEDCFELGLFVRGHRDSNKKPLLAVGMGANGQLSRITSPISLVTHPLIPFPSAPGQLSLAEVHQARHLMGLLPRRVEFLTGTESVAQKVASGLEAAFGELGYPYKCAISDSRKEAGFDCTGLESRQSIVEAVARRFSDLTGRPAPLSVIEQSI